MKGRVLVRRTITKRSDFRFNIPARSDRNHSWAQHAKADSYFHQVLRRWEHLAAMNNGFVYEKTSNTAENAHHYRKADAPCREVVQRIKKFCREKGVISDDVVGTSQRGHRVLGFYLADHAKCCQIVNGWHVLTPDYDPDLRRKRLMSELHPSRSEVAPESRQSRSGVEAESHQLDFEVAFGVAPIPPQDNPKAENTRSKPRSGMWFGGPESYKSCQSLESCESSESADLKSVPQKPEPSPLPFKADHDPGGQKKNTIQQTFDIEPTDGLEEIISALSDGKFDTEFLGTYDHRLELKEACLRTLSELASEHYLGSQTRAKIVGRVMDLLAAQKIAAPRFFTKMLRAWRNGNGNWSKHQTAPPWPVFPLLEESQQTAHELYALGWTVDSIASGLNATPYDIWKELGSPA